MWVCSPLFIHIKYERKIYKSQTNTKYKEVESTLQLVLEIIRGIKIAYQSRGHIISTAAEDISRRIINELRSLDTAWRVGHLLMFHDTDKERKYLLDVVKKYHSKVDGFIDYFFVHGTTNCPQLCQILTDGELEHRVGDAQYSNLALVNESANVFGHHNSGWGEFVIKLGTLNDCREKSKDKDYMGVPLDILEGIILPTPAVPIVRKEFPKYANLLKGYSQLARKIERGS